MEEISSNVLMTAFTFLSMAIGVKLDSHINVNLIPKRAPQWIHTGLLKLEWTILAIIGAVLVYYAILLILGIKARIVSIPILPASLQSIMMPLAGLLILFFLGLKEIADYFGIYHTPVSKVIAKAA